jgi:uncharacterized protein (DUF1810 family)
MVEFEHFVAAQEPVYDRVLRELRAGRKETHWMWFIFPQLAGLGHSSMAQCFALDDVETARRYWKHDLLGPRLRECTKILLDLRIRPIHAIFDVPDDLKFRSSMTLFALCVPGNIFDAALTRYFAGQQDEKTLKLLGLPVPETSKLN